MVAGMTLTYLLVRVKRKTMFFASAICSGFGLAMFSTILLISENGQNWGVVIRNDILSWMSLVAASLFVFSVNLGVQPLTILMSSELYPSSTRAICKVTNKQINNR